MSGRRKNPSISIDVRLDHGNLTVNEVCELKTRSKTGFYEDLKVGLVAVRKIGRRTVVPGPVARAYIAGEPPK